MNVERSWGAAEALPLSSYVVVADAHSMSVNGTVVPDQASQERSPSLRIFAC